MKPSIILINDYLLHLRRSTEEKKNGIPGRGISYNCIKNYVGAIGSTLRDYGENGFDKDADYSKLLSKIKEDSRPNKAIALELQDDLPKLFNAIFGPYNSTPSYFDKVKYWCRIILQISIFARSSDVTTYCPDLENVKFPDNTNHILSDGVPRWIIISFKDWKRRTTACKQRNPYYKIRLYANEKNLQFCPVRWLLLHWKLRLEKGEDISKGPICSKMTTDTYQEKLRDLGKLADLKLSSHSLRCTGAQWAKRCGADLDHIRNIGRWVDTGTLMGYIAEALNAQTIAMNMNNGIDPVWNFWFFDTNSQIHTIAPISTKNKNVV